MLKLMLSSIQHDGVLYNFHKLDLYGQKKNGICVLNNHINRDQNLNFLHQKETPSIPDV